MQTSSYDPGTTGGNREYLLDKITVVEPEETPFVSSVRKIGGASSTLVETLADTLDEPRIGGSSEGKPKTGANNKAGKRARFGNYQHRNFREWAVSDVQQDVSRNRGVAGVDDEAGNSKAKCVREFKRDMEAICLSNQEMQGGSEDEMRTRGFFKWIQNGAQSTNPVPADFRTPTASIQSGVGTSIPLFTELALNTQLKSIKAQFGTKQDLDMFAGDDVVDTIDRFTRTNESTTNARYQVQENASAHEITMFVTVFESSFARLNVINDDFVRFGSSSTTGETNAAAICKNDLWEIHFLEELFSKDNDDDDGSGESGWLRAKFAQLCLNPLGNGAIYNT